MLTQDLYSLYHSALHKQDKILVCANVLCYITDGIYISRRIRGLIDVVTFPQTIFRAARSITLHVS